MPISTIFLLNVEQASVALGCTPKWLADQLRARRFPGRKIGRKWMLSGEYVDEILKICAVKPQVMAGHDASKPEVSHRTSMTRTTARRMGRGDR